MRSRLATVSDASVIPALGGMGRPVGISGSEGFAVAAAYYACAYSLTKYLVERWGLAAVVLLAVSSSYEVELRRLTGLGPASLRAAWLRTLRSVP